MTEGQPRTIRQVYRALVSKHEAGGNPSAEFAAQQIGEPAGRNAQPVVPSRFSPDNMSFTGLFKNEPSRRSPQSPLNPVGAGGSAFFTQLYGQ